jgi:hypothetical protein
MARQHIASASTMSNATATWPAERTVCPWLATTVRSAPGSSWLRCRPATRRTTAIGISQFDGADLSRRWRDKHVVDLGNGRAVSVGKRERNARIAVGHQAVVGLDTFEADTPAEQAANGDMFNRAAPSTDRIAAVAISSAVQQRRAASTRNDPSFGGTATRRASDRS